MKRIFVLTFIALSFSFTHQTSAETAELLSETFRETLRPAANTGGARVMGIQIVGSDPATELQAFMPTSWAGETFCVRTGTAGGLYDSENTYRAPMDTTDPVIVPHVERSEHPDKLAALGPQSFGVRLLKGTCEDSSDATSGALAIWRSASQADEFVLFVNSFDADRLVARPSNGDTVECGPISADISVAFDKLCTIPFSQGQGRIEVTLIPLKDGRRGRPEVIMIDLP